MKCFRLSSNMGNIELLDSCGFLNGGVMLERLSNEWRIFNRLNWVVNL